MKSLRHRIAPALRRMLMLVLFWATALCCRSARLNDNIREVFPFLTEDDFCTISSAGKPVNVVLIGAPSTKILAALEAVAAFKDSAIAVFCMPFQGDTANAEAVAVYQTLSPIPLHIAASWKAAGRNFLAIDAFGTIRAQLRTGDEHRIAELLQHLKQRHRNGTPAGRSRAARVDEASPDPDVRSFIPQIANSRIREIEQRHRLINLIVDGGDSAFIAQLGQFPELCDPKLAVFVVHNDNTGPFQGMPPNWFDIHPGCLRKAVQSKLRFLLFDETGIVYATFSANQTAALRIAITDARSRILRRENTALPETGSDDDLFGKPARKT